MNDFCGFWNQHKVVSTSFNVILLFSMNIYRVLPEWEGAQVPGCALEVPMSWSLCCKIIISCQSEGQVVERRDRGWWELCRKHRRVLDLSTLDRSGKGHLGSPFPILESSSGSPPHVDTAPAPMLKSTSSSCSYSAVWVAILDSFTLSRCPNSISKICLAVPVMMWKCMCVYE